MNVETIMKEINIINKESDKYAELSNPMFELRHSVFKEKLNWEVSSEDNKEKDEYDDEDNANYVLVTDDEDDVVGCMRLLPTTGPYMLKNTFPELAKDILLPEEENVWEISRFAVEDKNQTTANKFGFGETTKHLAIGMCNFAIENNIKSYVGLTTPHVERLIRNLGLTCNRVSKVEQISDLKVVIIEIVIDEKGLNTVKEKLKLDKNLTLLDPKEYYYPEFKRENIPFKHSEELVNTTNNELEEIISS